MNRFESKYFNTALLMNQALLQLLQTKDLEFITIKDICQKAGVNRSTFYLHYENVNDLVDECTENLNKKFFDSFESVKDDFSINNSNLDDLILISSKYLTPYLEFIKENKNILKTYYKHTSLLKANSVYDKLFEEIFNPILMRFGFCKEDNEYMMQYYINGISAIIVKWLNSNCIEKVEHISDLIIKCVRPNR